MPRLTGCVALYWPYVFCVYTCIFFNANIRNFQAWCSNFLGLYSFPLFGNVYSYNTRFLCFLYCTSSSSLTLFISQLYIIAFFWRAYTFGNSIGCGIFLLFLFFIDGHISLFLCPDGYNWSFNDVTHLLFCDFVATLFLFS